MASWFESFLKFGGDLLGEFILDLSLLQIGPCELLSILLVRVPRPLLLVVSSLPPIRVANAALAFGTSEARWRAQSSQMSAASKLYERGLRKPLAWENL